MDSQKISTSPTKRTIPPRQAGQKGYVLLVFVLFSAVLIISLSAIIPKAAFEGQRDKEEELIFRGMQYHRAIQLFFRKFGRYPNSVEELDKTNGFRFLRRRFRDPMTKEGAWRLIHIGPGGAFIDALTSPLAPPTAATSTASGTSPSQPGSTGLGPGSQPSTSGGRSQPSLGQGLGQPPTGGLSPTGLSGPTAGPGVEGSQPGQLGLTPPGLAPSANPGANPQQQPRAFAQGQQPGGGTPSAGTQETSTSTPTSFPQGTSSPVFGGGGIAGFASKSTDESIRTWNKNTEYDKWEFIYDYRQDPVAVAALARLTGVQTQVPGQPATGPAASPQVPRPQPGAPPTQVPSPFQQPPSINNPGGFPPPGPR